jgi:hypothetical protein
MRQPTSGAAFVLTFELDGLQPPPDNLYWQVKLAFPPMGESIVFEVVLQTATANDSVAPGWIQFGSSSGSLRSDLAHLLEETRQEWIAG